MVLGEGGCSTFFLWDVMNHTGFIWHRIWDAFPTSSLWDVNSGRIELVVLYPHALQKQADLKSSRDLMLKGKIRNVYFGLFKTSAMNVVCAVELSTPTTEVVTQVLPIRAARWAVDTKTRSSPESRHSLYKIIRYLKEEGHQVIGITAQYAEITSQSLKKPWCTQWYMLMLPYHTIFLFYPRVAFCLWITFRFIFFEEPFQTQPTRYCYCAYPPKASLLDEELKQAPAPEQNDFAALLVLLRTCVTRLN